jgi:hypothetical protein
VTSDDQVSSSAAAAAAPVASQTAARGGEVRVKRRHKACTLLLLTIELVSRAAAARSYIHIIMDRIISRDNVGSPERQWGSSRLATVLLLGVCNLICYADRVNIGVAILPMKAELGMDKSTEAMVLSSFFWG